MQLNAFLETFTCFFSRKWSLISTSNSKIWILCEKLSWYRQFSNTLHDGTQICWTVFFTHLLQWYCFKKVAWHVIINHCSLCSNTREHIPRCGSGLRLLTVYYITSTPHARYNAGLPPRIYRRQQNHTNHSKNKISTYKFLN